MKKRWSQYPSVLRQKILLTFLAGLSSVVISCVVYVVTADHILLALGGIVFLSSLVFCKNFWDAATLGQYEVIEGTCVSINTPVLRRYRKIKLIDHHGAEFTLLLNKAARFQIGGRYRFYFRKNSHLAVGNDYLNAALSTNNFLGYETLDSTVIPDETGGDQAPH